MVLLGKATYRHENTAIIRRQWQTKQNRKTRKNMSGAFRHDLNDTIIRVVTLCKMLMKPQSKEIWMNTFHKKHQNCCIRLLNLCYNVPGCVH